MAANSIPELTLTPLHGKPRTVREWLTTFHLVFVALDPGKPQTPSIVPTAARVLENFREADCRVAWLVGGDAPSARRALGPWASSILTFVDPDHVTIKGLGISRLPALVHLGADGTVFGADEGFHPQRWNAITAQLAAIMRWSAPVLPGPRDPAPFEGTPVLP